MFLFPCSILDIGKRISRMHQSWSEFPPMRLSLVRQSLPDVYLPLYIFFTSVCAFTFLHQPWWFSLRSRLIFGARVLQMFLHPFNISWQVMKDHRNISTNDGRFNLRYVLFLPPNWSGCFAIPCMYFWSSQIGYNSCTSYDRVSLQRRKSRADVRQ